MVETQIMSVIRLWAAIAWSDGVLAEAEAQGLRRLIATAELSAEERAQAKAFVESRTTLPEAYLDMLQPDARRGIYRAACRMAVVDRVLAMSERMMLDRVRQLLAIPSEIAQEIEADVPGFA